MTDQIFDNRQCTLGEGPLWHPERGQLLWFDILGKRLLTQDDTGPRDWDMGEYVSAAGWVDRDRLLVASQSALFLFSLSTGTRNEVVPLEADNPITRSNDGRADPWGGFWIGTMGINFEPGAGSIYRYFRGELRRVFGDITVTNTMCFTPDRAFAYFSDTPTGLVMRQPLDAETGWPKGAPEVYLDLRAEKLNADGAVIDTSGNMWLAEWGAARVAVYDPSGQRIATHPFPARQTSCAAFGGPDLTTLYCTSARTGLADEVLTGEPTNGMTFQLPNAGQGQAEHQVIL